jgi:hypothetical protein
MKNKIDNLVRYSLFCHKVMDVDMLGNSPDYIIEKWTKFIGFKPTKDSNYYSQVRNDTRYIKYKNRWNLSDSDFDDIAYIMAFTYAINDYGIKNVSSLIDMFQSNFGSIYNINDVLYNGMHTLLVKAVDDWINNANIISDYDLCQLKYGRDYKISLLEKSF